MNDLSCITKESFAAYGTILEFSEEAQKNEFEILVREEEKPWRLAVYRVKNRKCARIERHNTSMESFEPVSGVGILLVAKDTDNVECFVLDKAVCLHKGIWHSMISLSEECIVKISENLEVDTEFFDLEKEVSAVIV